jgi:nitric oxide synthase oxygenase domain/subunit
MKKPRLGRVYLAHSYVIDLNDENMIEYATDALYEDIMSAIKYGEIQSWIEIKEDKTAKVSDIPEFLTEKETL